MKHRPLSEGIKAILQFCRDNRVTETVQHYQEACKAIEKIYNQKKIIDYDEDLTANTIQELRTQLPSSRIAKYSLNRYIYRTLCMLQDYYRELPFRHIYPGSIHQTV